MTVKRVMGTETEYAVSLNTPDRYNPVQLSFDVVNGAADSHSKSIRWDYRQEDPVNDARGTRLERAAARPDMLTDAPQLNITNVIAPNGGRVYVDHAHPEYSAPETTDPFEAVRYDHAGDLIMQAATERARKQTGTPIALHRNNVDGKGSCWGTHENYMMARAVPFDLVTRLMTLHFVTRQIYAGSGRVGIGENSEIPGYQLSQRADYIHAKVGLQTTFERPIINTRDESHSTDAYRRLHVIVGDANRMEVPQALKLGTTSMLLWLLEHADEAGFDLNAFLDELELADPVEAIHTVSRDLTLGAILPLANGGETNAWLIQLKLRQAVYQVAALVEGTDTAGEPAWPDKSTTSIMAMWQQALIDCASIRHAADDDEQAGEEQDGRPFDAQNDLLDILTADQQHDGRCGERDDAGLNTERGVADKAENDERDHDKALSHQHSVLHSTLFVQLHDGCHALGRDHHAPAVYHIEQRTDDNHDKDDRRAGRDDEIREAEARLGADHDVRRVADQRRRAADVRG